MGTVYLQKDQWQLRNYFRNKAILSAFQNTGKSIQILSSSSASSSLQLSKKKKSASLPESLFGSYQVLKPILFSNIN